MKTRPIVGILGGMGPEATADLFMKILRATPAKKDQDHLHVVIDNRSQVPDRTAAIFGEGEDPRPELVAGVGLLLTAGADLIVVPCNTAHYFHSAMQEAAGGVPVLHMMREVGAYLSEPGKQIDTVGLLATSGTIRSQLYHRALAEVGIDVVVPAEAEQQRVMKAIYDDEQGIKAGQYNWPQELLRAEAQRLVDRGAQAIIAGCTEIPLALHQDDVEVEYVDATEILAQAAVGRARGLI